MSREMHFDHALPSVEGKQYAETVEAAENIVNRLSGGFASTASLDANKLRNLALAFLMLHDKSADSARLDWLEAEDRRLFLRPIWSREKGGWQNEWHVGETVLCPKIFSAPTLREAIDAARNPVSIPEVLATSEGDNG